MSEFKREGRYIVVKPDCEDSLRTERLRNYIDDMCFHTPDCVVVEADWPEYETVWRMIERRVTGASADAKPVEVLGYSVVGNRYAIRLTKGEVLDLSENYADHLIELVDRKHLTDAQSELAALREELANVKRGKDNADLALNTQTKNKDRYKLRATAAEQRNVELVELLRHVFYTVGYWNSDTCDRVEAALKPTESGAIDPEYIGLNVCVSCSGRFGELKTSSCALLSKAYYVKCASCGATTSGYDKAAPAVMEWNSRSKQESGASE